MKSYKQFCALAKGLDVVGDRWTLLIVRELVIRGSCRYADLRNGLPGIASNLLTARLKHLEAAAIIYRRGAPPPIATTLFHLTERGQELESVINAIGHWGKPLLANMDDRDALCGHWLALPLRLYLRDLTPAAKAVTIELQVGDEAVSLTTTGNPSVRAATGGAEKPDCRITGSPRLILGLLLRKIDLKTAEGAGLQIEGDDQLLNRIAPTAE
jgi:DNA-binding HxlR family transcriptional regulator